MVQEHVEDKAGRKVLVLGAYGLIGSEVCRQLIKVGHSVTGLGRDEATAKSVLPDISWIIRDLSDLCESQAWLDFLSSFDVVVNCAGALQESYRDDLEVVHTKAIGALVRACKTLDVSVVQISSVGAVLNASTPFLRTKAEGDELVRMSGVRYCIFRPGLVIAPSAYGGTALLRMLASFPIVQPIAYAKGKVQTVFVEDLALAVASFVDGDVPNGTECDLVEERVHSLKELIVAHRAWLGFQPARSFIYFPDWFVGFTSSVANLLGRLGWRSPLRSSAMEVMKEGVVGDARQWKNLKGAHVRSIDETFKSMSAHVEDRLFAWMALLMPVMVGGLSLFWFISGVIGFYSIEKAAQVLIDVGWAKEFAMISVAFWAVIDLVLAGAILIRRYAKLACWGMIGVSLFYLLASTLIVPSLWLDPLGPMVKVLPSLGLALVVRVLLESR
ncbi:MAG: SDR family oxidoreductase [Rhizobiales bacterium]|nr:SDR family oxidoreductase [Hyphomicrobiales bacterium]